MKVLLANTLYPPSTFGGAERSVETLARNLQAAGIETAVHTLNEDGECEETIDGVRIYRRPLRNRYWPYATGPRPNVLNRALWHWRDRWNSSAGADFKLVLDSFKPDIVHTHNLAGMSVVLWQIVQQLGLPLVHTLRDYYLVHPQSTVVGDPARFGLVHDLFWQRRKRALSAGVNAVVGIADKILSDHQRLGYFPGVTAKRIYNVIDTDDSPFPARGERGYFVLGFMGRVEERKGIAQLIGCLRQYNGPDKFHLLVAGNGQAPYLSKLREQAAGLPVEFIGFAESSEFFQQIDLLVVPSLVEEAFGRVVVEAASVGVPSLVSDRGGLPELVTELGRGEIFNPNDSHSFCQALERAAADLQSPRPFQLAPFSADTATSAHLELYHHVLKARHG